MRAVTILGAAVLIGSAVATCCGAEGPVYMDSLNDENGPPVPSVAPGPVADVVPDPLRWTVTADALILWRRPTEHQSLLSGMPGGTEVYNSSDLRAGAVALPRLSLIYHGGPDWQLEGNYFGVDSWEAHGSMPTPSDVGPFLYYSLRIDDQPPPDVYNASFRYSTTLRSAEFNLREHVRDWFIPLIGFRWLELTDEYRVAGTEYPGSEAFSHTIKSKNNLYGCQVGLDAAVSFDPSFRVEGICKAGLFFNGASQRGTFVDVGGTYGSLSAAATRDRAAFFGEVGLSAVWQVMSHVAIRAGYQVMWLNAVALAPEQIPVTDLINTHTARVDVHGNLVIHGLNVGAEITW